MLNVQECSSYRAARHIVAMLAGSVIAIVFCMFLTSNIAAALPCSATNDATLATALTTATCTTIDVDPGSYTGPVNIMRAVILNGANAGIDPNTDTRSPESVISSPDGTVVINITASDVVVDGFTLTHSSNATGSNGAYGIDIQASAAGTVIANNIITEIVAGPDAYSTAQAIYLVHGPNGVVIKHNAISNVSSVGSAKGVFIGDSNSTNSSNVVIIDGNKITDITSQKKGAYGVTINNGSNPVGTTQNSALVIENNDISGLHSDNLGWVHAVGIEADAPGVVVTGNSFSDLTTASGVDNVAVWFESEDLSYASSMVNYNSFNFGKKGSDVYGIAVGFVPDGLPSLDGTCNYWGTATGPGVVGPGKGALVTPLVTFSPWEKTANGPCAPKKEGKDKND